MQFHPRCLRQFLSLLLILISTTTAIAQPPIPEAKITEADVVRLALHRAPVTDALAGAIASQQAKRSIAEAYVNPRIIYMREQTFGTFGSGENYLSVAQAISLGDKRRNYAAAGQLRILAAEQDGDAKRLAIAADARMKFYEVLYCQLRVTALERWNDHVSEALRVVTRRAQGGDVALYDQKRIEREQNVAQARLATSKAVLVGAGGRLRSIIDDSTTVLVATGPMLPETEPATVAALRQAASTRPDLTALHLELQAAARTQAAAARWWLPDLQLEAGWKGVDLGNGQRTDGFLLGVSMTMPLWDQSTGLVRAAQADAQIARARRALLESELNGELTSTRAEALELRSIAVTQQTKISALSTDLIRITSIGYEGGELGVLELLDAYRGVADDELAVVDMAYAARQAQLALDKLTGTGKQ